MNDAWIAELANGLPDHAAVVAGLAGGVESVECWRSLVVGCSLGAGRGDRFSDIDAGIGYADSLPVEDLEPSGRDLIERAGHAIDVLVHRYDGWPDDSRRFAVEYENGIQLDLTTFRRRGGEPARRMSRSWTRTATSPNLCHHHLTWSPLACTATPASG